ncbi:uncharacterized protein RCC_08477 [Ramularia collo-cygni]|uniref:Protein kinase domain-containing protein n=1 Tax=Ramularia collo-cygni TaxID=112498 RepID=A0A2D3V7A4_9PEZI|nr:uncharacterized protein RCC_08477 [Ramularia collo-cygni]CZT22770.1 uncharacterized protein RCC_08477 [Ramularia collo-cygni]
MAVRWKMPNKSLVRYSAENPPTVSNCMTLSTRQERPGAFHAVVQVPQRTHVGTLMVAVDQASLIIPDEYKDSSAKPYALIDFDKSQVRVDSSYSGSLENPKWSGFPRLITKFMVAKVADLTIHLYIPTASDDQDILLGYVRLLPDFEANDEERQFTFRLLDLHRGGTIRVGAEYLPSKTESGARQVWLKQPSTDYEGLHVRTYALQDMNIDRVYAAKRFCKREAQSPAWYAQFIRKVDHPFIAPLLFTVETSDEIYLLSPLICGGHLYHYLQMDGGFELERATHYAAEIVSALAYVQSLDIMFQYCGRLQPSNLRLDVVGHIMICDFELHIGYHELVPNQEDMQWNAYPSPELLLGLPTTKTTDWWTLGSILFKMLLGVPPFVEKNRQAAHSRILANKPLLFPEPNSLTAEAKDILRRLLCAPQQRLGLNGTWEIEEHPFFRRIDWGRLRGREYTPAFKPSDEGPAMIFSTKQTEKERRLMDWQFALWGMTIERKPLPRG